MSRLRFIDMIPLMGCAVRTVVQEQIAVQTLRVPFFFFC
jgi:hypothetical protein